MTAASLIDPVEFSCDLIRRPSVTPADAGDYKFHCEIHKSMTGTLTVE